MIDSYRDKRTPEFAKGTRFNAFAGFERKAEMKIDQLDAATSLLDLNLPGIRLEAVKENRKGQHSIRINDQFRICFEWPKRSPGPVNVEIVDYHFGLQSKVTLASGDTIALWSSQDALVIKVLTWIIQEILEPPLSMNCYQLKGHGGLKGAVRCLYASLVALRNSISSSSLVARRSKSE
jgi:toxin HigB-1